MAGKNTEEVEAMVVEEQDLKRRRNAHAHFAKNAIVLCVVLHIVVLAFHWVVWKSALCGLIVGGLVATGLKGLVCKSAKTAEDAERSYGDVFLGMVFAGFAVAAAVIIRLCTD